VDTAGSKIVSQADGMLLTETVRTVGLVRVTVDEHRMRQVITDLVSNAMAHTPPGTPVHVRVGRAAEPPDPLSPWRGVSSHAAASCWK
jgi:signal transduction histidine kinase